MTPLADRIAFCESEIVNNKGNRFSVDGRDWVVENLFRPLQSHKLWPVDPSALCRGCKRQAGSLIEWTPELEDGLSDHRHETPGCEGLTAEPVFVVVLNLQRGAGKTFNSMAWVLSELTLGERRSVGFLAKAGKQTRTLVRENLHDPITSNDELAGILRIIGDRVENYDNGSFFELVDTSHGSATGRRRDILFIDEARDVDARTFAALLPSIKTRSSWECPSQHVKYPMGREAPATCSVCGDALKPYFPRIVITSTSGVLDGSEKDWFNELVDHLEKNPSPWAHLYRDDEAANPDEDERENKVIKEVFGEVESLATYIEVETTNQPRRKGDPFVTDRQLDTITNRDFRNAEGSDRRCFGFLDTSKIHDRTTLVLAAEAPGYSKPWEMLEVIRYDVWDPAKQPGGRIKQSVIQEHLDEVVPLFPNLQRIEVDTRGRLHGMSWAADLVSECRKERPIWGRKIHSFNDTTRREIGWQHLEYRIHYNKIRIPPEKILRKELKGVSRGFDNKGNVVWKDINRKISHADIAESIANICRMVLDDMRRPRAKGLGKLAKAHKNKIIRNLYKPESIRRPELYA